MDLKEVISNTILKDKKKLTSKLLTKVVYETDICNCGNEFDTAYTLQLPDKVTGYFQNKCDQCRLIEQTAQLMEETAKEFEEKHQKRIEDEFYNNSLLNDKLRLATFESYMPTSEELAKAKSLCQRYANNFNMNNPVSLLLIGNYGTGKSHLAVATAKEIIKKGRSCLFVSTPKLLSLLRSTYNKGSAESEDTVLKRFIKIDVLIVDDIGAEQTKKRYDENEHDWATSKIFELIDSRIGKHTIYTSNFKPNELQERLGGRNFSRMMEGTHVIKMNGDDYRLRDFK